MRYLCKGLSASCNSPRLLNKGSCFLTDPLSIMDAPLGILPSSQGSLAAGFRMDLKGFKIKSTWTLSTCNINFEACVQKQEDRHALQEYCFVQNANILLPALTAPLPYTVFLGGRVSLHMENSFSVELAIS